MQLVAAPKTTSIMAVAAHPDDIESWCAGTLALAIDQGASVRILLVTSGQSGSSNSHATRQQVGTQREQEALVAAARLGIAEVRFLRYEDGEVENNQALRRDLVEWIRRWRSEVLFTHDPEHPLPSYLSHRDHRIVGRAALDAIYPLARDPLSFNEQVQAGLAPHAVHQAWLFASSEANRVVDISASFERKLQARLAHTSQTVSSEELKQSWRERAATIGAALGVPLAEVFTVLNIS